jgi:hypothetical protein
MCLEKLWMRKFWEAHLCERAEESGGQTAIACFATPFVSEEQVERCWVTFWGEIEL